MSKLFKTIFLISLLSLVFLTGCDDSKGGEDTHYKPSEYKHNVAINNASSTISDIDREIISMGSETSADIVYTTYNESLTKLREQLTILENTKKQLSDDKDLTNSEVKSWTSEYNSTIKGVQNKINDVETKLENFLK